MNNRSIHGRSPHLVSGHRIRPFDVFGIDHIQTAVESFRDCIDGT
jgi:hypothetical protein